MNRIPFSSLASFSSLFKDYTEDFGELAPYFNGDYRSDADLARVSARAAEQHPDRRALVSALTGQAAGFGLEESSASMIADIGDPESVAVVTGQQLGLFGGPLYTLFKSISAIQLAKRVTSVTGRKAVPVFWLEGEDHDFEEIAAAGFLNGDDAQKIVYSPERGAPSSNERASGVAVGRIVLTEEIESTLSDLESILAPTDFRGQLLLTIREAYRPGRTMNQAFAGMTDSILGPGRILFISPDDAALKAIAKPLFLKEIDDFSGSSALLEDASLLLEKQYHAQVKTRPTNIFLHQDNHRSALDVEGDGFRTRNGVQYSREALLSLLENQPELFSPNVVLRPLMQDFLLPTAAYVAGPAEVAYFAQFKSLYQWAGIEMPIIYPRASVTLLEKRISKITARYELGLSDIEMQFEELFRKVVLSQMEGDLAEEFKAASTGLHKAIDDIKPVIERVDRSLVRSADALRASFMKEWSRLQDRVVKAEKKRNETLKTQLARASSNLFPFGIPQERAISPVYFLNKYGPDWGQFLIDTLELDTTSHQIIEI